MNVPARTLWLDRTGAGVIVMSAASDVVVGRAATWLPPCLQLELGVSQATAGWLISAVFALQSPLLPAGAWLCQPMQRHGIAARPALGHASTAALMAAGTALLGRR